MAYDLTVDELKRQLDALRHRVDLLELALRDARKHRVDLMENLHERIRQYLKQFKEPISLRVLTRTIGSTFKRANLNLRDVLIDDPKIRHFLTLNGGYVFVLEEDVEQIPEDVLIKLIGVTKETEESDGPSEEFLARLAAKSAHTDSKGDSGDAT